MKTIRKKLLFLILMLVIIASLANSFAGLYATSEVLDSEAEKIMNLMCEQNAAKIDNVFYSIADMVGSLAIRAKAEISDINQLENQAFLEEYTDMLEKSALSYAKEMKGALAFYVAYNPEYTSPTAGFFWKRQKTDQDFVKVPRTDLYAYDKDDIEHVGWYYIPVENQEPTWMMPYNNKNLNEWTISYVVPIYMNRELIGVVGMDFDFSIIEKEADNIRIYDGGYAFIVGEDGQMVHHPE